MNNYFSAEDTRIVGIERSDNRQSVSLLTLAGAIPVPVFLMRFSVETFNLEWFFTESIPCPPAIARSVRKRQAEYFHGRACARTALESIGIFDFSIDSGCSREPLWPSGVIGSITHNDRFAAASAVLATNYSGVGIDIERVVTEESRDPVLAIAVRPDERALLSTTESLCFDQCLSLIFSVKESFFKAAFGVVGRYFDFTAVSVTRIDIKNKCIDLVVKETLCKEFTKGVHISGHYDFIDPHTLFTAVLW